jgi:hypothetical protein
MKSSTHFSILLTTFLVALIVLSGPGYGVSMVINGLSFHARNETPIFSVISNLQQDELVPINYINLTITQPNATKIKCTIFPNGTIRGCDVIKFVSFSSSGSYDYGYGYGYDNEVRYDLGYGYGYAGPGVINFTLILNTSQLSMGNHQIKAELFDGHENTHLFSSTTSNFFISIFGTTTTTVPTTTSTTTQTTTTTMPVTTTTQTTSTTALTTTSTPSTTSTTTITTTTQKTTTTIITTITSTIQTSTTVSTTPASPCNGKSLPLCVVNPECEWFGDSKLGYCKQKIATTTTLEETTITTPAYTTTTMSVTTTTIPSICDGKGFINCILMSQCKWVGDTRMGKCIFTGQYTTTTVAETTMPTTTTVQVNCGSKSLFSCLTARECVWTGDLMTGYCREK